MLGKPYVAPQPCQTCSHKPAYLQFEPEDLDAFEACFTHHLRIKDTAKMQADTANMEHESDFLQSLFLDLEQLPPSAGSSSSDSSDSSSKNFHDGDDGSPATELSSASPPKFGELDLDGFTPGAPTFGLDSQSKSTSDVATSPDYLNYKPSNTYSGAITPGKTIFTNPTLASANPSQFKPSLSIHTSQQRPTNQAHSTHRSVGSMDDFTPLIDPALTSYNGLPSAVESEFDSAFSHIASEPPSAIEPQSAVSTKAKKASKASNASDQSAAAGTKEGKPQAKRKRARKTTPSSPADAEKQARFLERNRNAASRCRARRKAQNDRLEIRAGELERERDGLRMLEQSLMSEKMELLGRVLELGCSDNCNGVEGLATMGGVTGKPPRDLLVSALNEMAVRPMDETLFKEESDAEDDTEMVTA